MASNCFPRGQGCPLLTAAISVAGMLLLLEAIQYQLPKIIDTLQHGMHSASAALALLFAAILLLAAENGSTRISKNSEPETQKRESA